MPLKTGTMNRKHGRRDHDHDTQSGDGVGHGRLDLAPQGDLLFHRVGQGKQAPCPASRWLRPPGPSPRRAGRRPWGGSPAQPTARRLVRPGSARRRLPWPGRGARSARPGSLRARNSVRPALMSVANCRLKHGQYLQWHPAADARAGAGPSSWPRWLRSWPRC